MTSFPKKLYSEYRFTELRIGIENFGPFFVDMLKDDIRKNELFIDLSSVLESVGIKIVAVNSIQLMGVVNVSIIIKKADGVENVDDCAMVYNTVLPRLSLTFGTREINLEVSTPGIQRVFKDYYEFELFTGKRCRIYHNGMNATISGIIASCSDSKVVLKDWINEDNSEKGEELEVSFADIYKAKLDYKWEDVK